MGVRVLLPFPLSAHAAGYTLDDYTMLDVRRYGVKKCLKRVYEEISKVNFKLQR